MQTCKYAKKDYRRTCRSAFNGALKVNFELCDKFFRDKRMGKFWNKIRQSKYRQDNHSRAVASFELEKYFGEKFAY